MKDNNVITINSIDDNYENLQNLFRYIGNREILCYGAGKYGSLIFAYLKQRRMKPSGFIISDKNGEKDLFGVPVHSIKDVKISENTCILVTVSERFLESVVANIVERGFDDYYVVTETLLNEIKNEIISRNTDIKTYCKDLQRCFLVCTGPSIMNQDLSLLCRETVFSCSFSPLLKIYETIAPQFYVTPAITNDGENYEYCLEKMRFLSENVISPIIIADYNDYSLIINNDFFADKKVFYYCQTTGFPWSNDESIIDMTRETPGVQGTAIMMLKTAMYLGYKEVILLGVEHTFVKETVYKHAFDFYDLKKRGYEKLYRIMIDHNSKSEGLQYEQSSRSQDFQNLIDQYRFLRDVAKKKNIVIVNASQYTHLEEFEKREYMSFFTS